MMFSYFRPDRMGTRWSMSAGPLISIIAVSGPGGGMKDWTCCAVIVPNGPTHPGFSCRSMRLKLSFCCSARVLNSSMKMKLSIYSPTHSRLSAV